MKEETQIMCGTCNNPIKYCTCLNNNNTGAKYDGNKLKWDLLPIKEIEDIVKVLTDGASKYSPNNWKKVNNPQDRYYAALLRHLVAWRLGEEIDPESKRTHLSHAACCLLFLMWFDNNK